MAVLEKIRVKFAALITVVIALALLSFIIDPNTLQSVTSSMSSKFNVGEINGKSISSQEFQKEVDKYTTINEIISGQSSQNEQQQEAVKNAAWQSFIDKYIFIKKAKAAGIVVGEDEMLSLTTGDMLSPIIANNPSFLDESGAFSKERLVMFLNNIESDPSGRGKMYWDYIQNTILNQEYYAKYSSLFTSSNFTNSLMMDKKIEGNNVTANVEFVMVPYGFETDSTIVVSNKEINDYYHSKKENYKQIASRDIEYVVFEVVPSDNDIAETNKEILSVYDEFSTTESMKSFLLKNSDRQLSNMYYKAGELNSISPDVNDFVFENGSGVSGLFKNDNTFSAVRVLESKMLPDSVFVKHILLQGDNIAKADSLLNVLKSGKESISNVATLYSADKNTKVAEIGDLGWLTQTYMIPGMESVFDQELNEYFTLKTQYGTHIVMVSDKTELINKYKVAVLEQEVIPSNETYNDFYTKANTLASLAGGNYNGFKSAIDSLGLYAHPVNRMAESTDNLGAVDNTKEITRWAFEAKKGNVSDIITINKDYFFVVALKDIHKKGYNKVGNVAASIKSVLYAEKLADKKAAEVAAKINGLTDMNAIANALGTSVSTKDGIAFESLTAQGLDPIFIGAVTGAEEGKISAPLAGKVGTYVYKVLSKETGAFFTEDDAKNRDTQMAQYSTRMVLPVMMEMCGVEDNRARFF